MRKNEFNTLEDFTSQYVGEWNPSRGHWFGLNFAFEGKEYRFCTWSMYHKESTILPDGREAIFYLYEKNSPEDIASDDYTLLGEFADMADVLKNKCILGIPFEKVIIDENTELLGQD